MKLLFVFFACFQRYWRPWCCDVGDRTDNDDPGRPGDLHGRRKHDQSHLFGATQPRTAGPCVLDSKSAGNGNSVSQCRRRRSLRNRICADGGGVRPETVNYLKSRWCYFRSGSAIDFHRLLRQSDGNPWPTFVVLAIDFANNCIVFCRVSIGIRRSDSVFVH